jgi:hemoglobin
MYLKYMLLSRLTAPSYEEAAFKMYFKRLFNWLEKNMSRQKSLYEKLGGEAAVNAAVDIFYRKALSDDRISFFFKDADMEKQAAKQKSFLTMAFGGPHNYSGLDMRTGHAHLVERGLNDTHVDAVIERLAAALRELGIKEELICQVAAIAESTGNDVLGR